MPKKSLYKKTNNLPPVLIVICVLALAALVLLSKGGDHNQAQVIDASGIVPLQGGDVMAQTLAVPSELPADQLQNALAEHLPTLAFFHSNSCRQCAMMIEIVDQVYPEFAASVVLVDVYVYDEKNAPLLKKVGLQFIPTLIFYDRAGKEQVSVGVMEAEQLRQSLAALAEGD